MLEGLINFRCRPIPKFDHSKFMSRIKVNEENNCWDWVGSIYPATGYGNLFIDGRKYLAHRISYDIFHGIDNPHRVVDHTCSNRKCVNPDIFSLPSVFSSDVDATSFCFKYIRNGRIVHNLPSIVLCLR